MSRVVLLIEDDSDSRKVYRTILEHYGFEVIEAARGDEGIRLARELRPDIIVMDIAIPVVDGWEATRILKDDPRTKDVPVVVLTAYARRSDRRRAFEAGCDGFVAKPVTPRELAEEALRFVDPGTPYPPPHQA